MRPRFRNGQCELRSAAAVGSAWCQEHGIALKTYYNWERQIVKEAIQQYTLAAPAPGGMLVQVSPDGMASDDENGIEITVTIRHGKSVITLPAGSSAGAIADLVKALNRHV